MGNRERVKLKITDFKILRRRNRVTALDVFDLVAEFAGIQGCRGNKDRCAEGFGYDMQAAGVIAVFVGDDNRIDFMGVFADFLNAAHGFFAAQPAINQHPCFTGND